MLTKKEWKDLAKTALIGTDRVTPSVATLELLEELGVQAQDVTEVVLKGAGIMALLRKGGIELPDFAGSIPNACEPETQRYISSKSISHLKEILRGGHSLALNEFLYFAFRNERLIVPDLLPEVFEVAKNDDKAVKILPYVVGNRGVWLANNNADWSLVHKQNSQDEILEPKLTKDQTLLQVRELVEKIKSAVYVWSEDRKLATELKILSYQADYALLENIDFIFSNNLSYSYQTKTTEFLRVLIFRSKMVEELNNRNH